MPRTEKSLWKREREKEVEEEEAAIFHILINCRKDLLLREERERGEKRRREREREIPLPSSALEMRLVPTLCNWRERETTNKARQAIYHHWQKKVTKFTFFNIPNIAGWSWRYSYRLGARANYPCFLFLTHTLGI